MATPREQLADALKQARNDAGFTSHGQLAKLMVTSRSSLSRAENPREAVPSDALIKLWAKATGTDPEKLLEYAKRARYPRNWFAVWADDFESRATLIRLFEHSLVPGLVQTEAYARAVLSWKPFATDAEVTLRDRMARQSVLDRAELRMLILSSVLEREVGDASVMAEQIECLISLGERSSVMLQIVPDTPAIAGALGGAFAIATEDTTDVAAFSGSTIQGGVHTDHTLVTRAVKLFDGLRADALPWSQTRDRLEQVGSQWKQRTTG